MIEVKNLVKSYGSHVVINDVSFTMQEGKIYGLLGKNGVGKTTMMNMMTGYIGSTSGEIIINGHSILDEPLEAKKCIGYLPELPPVYGDMTVLEYLRFSAELKGVKKADREGEVRRVMELTDLVPMQKRLIKNLSKGYKQRVGLGNALMCFPTTLIFDEPTSGLDPYQIMEIRTLIKKLARDHTILLSSHILQEVSMICDEIIVLSDARIIASGVPAEIEKKLGGHMVLRIETPGDAAQVSNLLAPFSDIVRVKEEESHVFLVDVAQGKDLRASIFWAFSQAGIPILSMSQQAQSLEELFIELTEVPTPLNGTDGEEASS